MLAATGILTQEVYRLGDAFPSKNCIEALKTAPTAGLLQILFVIGAIEAQNSKYVGRVPGDRGFDPLKLSEVRTPQRMPARKEGGRRTAQHVKLCCF